MAVVFRGLVIWCVGVFSNVSANNDFWGGSSQPGGEMIEPRVIEAHAVDEGLVFRQPEQPGAWIASLAARRYRAYFYVAKAKVGQAVIQIGFFVKSRRNAHGIRETEAKHFPLKGSFIVEKKMAEKWRGTRNAK